MASKLPPPLHTKWKFFLQKAYSGLLPGIQACFGKYILENKGLRRQLQANNSKFYPTLLRKLSLKITSVAALVEQRKLKTCVVFPININIQANSVSTPTKSFHFCCYCLKTIIFSGWGSPPKSEKGYIFKTSHVCKHFVFLTQCMLECKLWTSQWKDHFSPI